MNMMNQCVRCKCGNDIIISVGGDDTKNTPEAELWKVKVDVKALNPIQECCKERMDMGLNNMMIGVDLFSKIHHLPIEVEVTISEVEHI